jgi:AbiU2
MPTPDARFERELNIFRTETEQATQFYFALLAINDVAYEDKVVHALLNRTALFWNTCAGALQTSAFIALGRVFDKHSAHNVDRVLRIAQESPQVFSKAALARRLERIDPRASGWIDEFVQDAYEPTPKDFRRLRTYVRKWQRIYEANYRDVRHKFFAHKETADETEVAELFRKGTNRELQQMFRFLGQLHRALWQLFFNGRKPVLRPARYSVAQMRKRPALPSYSGVGIQEHITREAEEFLKFAAKKH